MDLEVSTWTRRERLERIASAERDRRAGREELALATLGDGSEWPARVVLALIRLPQDEGAEARAILEGTLDAWAADTGLDGLDAASAAAALDAASDAAVDAAEEDAEQNVEEVAREATADAVEAAVEEIVEDASEATRDEASAAPSTADTLEAPIAIDELDRAFAEAEAQTDEMLDVNTVAARVLMEEPMGLMEIDDDGPSEPMPGEPITTDAAWALPLERDTPPSDYDIAPDEVGVADASDLDVATADESDDESIEEGAFMDAALVEEDTGVRPRKQVVETLERWLSNLERGRSIRNAQQNRGA